MTDPNITPPPPDTSNRYKRYGYMYAGAGIGLLLVLMAWAIEFYLNAVSFSFRDVIQIHRLNPILLIIDFAPIVLGLLAYQIGIREGHIQEDRSVLEKRVLDRTAEIAESQERFRAIMNNMADGVLTFDESGRIFSINPAAERIFGYALDELDAANISTLIPAFSESAITHNILSTLRSDAKKGSPIHEVTGLRKDKSEFPLELTISEMNQGGRFKLIAIVRDITSRRKAEVELQKARDYARSIIHSSLDMIISVDQDRKIIEFNDAAQQCFGYLKNEVIGRQVDMLYDDATIGIRIHDQIIEKGKFEGEVCNKKKNGDYFDATLSASVLLDDKGQMMGIMGISRDITESKKAEKSLRASEEIFRSLSACSPFGIYQTDVQGRCVYTNSRW
ncbi:MAG: PAS domain S-box protein, partial [Verrucomicrobiota bacterium]|nr:PAS domain S-box protein [Verrucomicrobiota bacterium]